MAGRHHIKLAIDSRLADVYLVGVTVRALGLAAGFSDEDAGLMQLALEEAVTNVIRHSFQGRAGHQVEVRVSVRSDRLVFVVSHQDRGQGGLQAWPAKSDRPPEATQEGGRGIFLINAIMDSVRYANRDGRACLTMSKKRVAG